MKERPEGSEIESGKDVADAAADGANSSWSSAGPATRCSIQGGLCATRVTSTQPYDGSLTGKRGRQSPLNDAVQGVVSPHLTTVQGGRQSPLNDGCHYGIWSTGVVSPLLTTQCKGASVPT